MDSNARDVVTVSPSPAKDAGETRERRASSHAMNGRKKRGAYVNRACDECKRRKSKCEGNQPCARCTKMGVDCVFPPRGPRYRGGNSDESTELELLRKKVDLLEGKLLAAPTPPDSTQEELLQASGSSASRRSYQSSTLGDSLQPASPFHGSNRPTYSGESHPMDRSGRLRFSQDLTTHDDTGSYQQTLYMQSFGEPEMTSNKDLQLPAAPNQEPADPSPIASDCSLNPSSASHSGTRAPATAHYKFNLSLAQSNLQALGVHPPVDEHITSQLPTRASSPVTLEHVAGDKARDSCDPVWLIRRPEALRLCEVYEDEIGLTYPFLDIHKVRGSINRLYDGLEAGEQNGFAFSPFRNDAIISPDELKITKMVFACALIIETSGSSSLAQRFVTNVKESTYDLIWQDVTIQSVTIYLLIAIYQFLADSDTLAWRTVGIVARWSLELGLNQPLVFQHVPGSDLDQKMLVRLFWCIHILDRRWSFGSGLPFVIQDEDVSQHFPEPDDGVPYLKAMVAFSRIVSNVWHVTYGTPIDSASRRGQEEMSYLKYRIERWWEELPVTLQFGRGDQNWSRGLQRQRILLYLRKAQLIILLYQPALHSPRQVRQRPQVARSVVETAKDIIQRLDHMNRTTDLYHKQQMCFNHFLVLALSVIFLAMSQAPGEFAAHVREEFNAALDLVQRLSKNSFVSKRLWRTIRSIRPLGDTLSVSTQASGQGGRQDTSHKAPHSSWANSRSRAGADFDTDLFMLDNDLQFPFVIPDESFDGLQLTENMNAVFEAMEKDWDQSINGRPLDGITAVGPDTSGYAA